MKRKIERKDKGFTLIELLVVVLIIGILSAIALPQYTLAVNRARFSNLRSLAAPLISAATVYHMANGTWPGNFEEMDVQLPGNFSTNSTTSGSMSYTCGANDQSFCCIIPGGNSASALIVCSNKEESYAYTFFLSNNQDYCIAKDTDANAKKLCKSFTGNNGSLTWGLYTPTGYKTGDYRFYQF